MPYPPPTPAELASEQEDRRLHREKVRAAFEEWEHPRRIRDPQPPIIEPALFDDLCDASMEIEDVARRNHTSIEHICDILDNAVVQDRLERVARHNERRAALNARLGLPAAARALVSSIQSHISDGMTMVMNPEHPKGYHLRLRAREGVTRNVSLLLRIAGLLRPTDLQPGSTLYGPQPTTPPAPTNTKSDVTQTVSPISPTKDSTPSHTSPARSVSEPFNPHTNQVTTPSPASTLLTKAATTNNPALNDVTHIVNQPVPRTSPTNDSIPPNTTEARSLSSQAPRTQDPGLRTSPLTVSAPRKTPCTTCHNCKSPCTPRAPPQLQPI